MDMEKSYEWVGKLKTRRRKLDPYKARILSWLKEHPDLSAAQISDWLEEQCQFSDVGESTVRTYVKELRELYVIPKVMSSRSYEALEDSPMGKQIQVDFGEIKVENTEGKKVKLYAIVFILSNARFKYVEWLDRPFTTQDVIRTHEHAFEFFGGRTEEIVYDQDRLMTVSENNGDIILTQAFQSYRDQRGFNFYLCRAADPESKGKVENAVVCVKLFSVRLSNKDLSARLFPSSAFLLPH
jgi:transposase